MAAEGSFRFQCLQAPQSRPSESFVEPKIAREPRGAYFSRMHTYILRLSGAKDVNPPGPSVRAYKELTTTVILGVSLERHVPRTFSFAAIGFYYTRACNSKKGEVVLMGT